MHVASITYFGKLCESFRVFVDASPCPRPIAAPADLKHRAHLIPFIVFALFVDPGVRHSVSLAKYAVAFVRSSFSRLSTDVLRAEPGEFPLLRRDLSSSTVARACRDRLDSVP